MSMQPIGQTSKEYFKVLSILHGALMGAQLLFAGVAFYINSSNQEKSNSDEFSSIFQIVVPTVIIGAMFGSSFLFKTQLKTIKVKPELKDKLFDYRSALIIKFAMLEAPSMLALVCYFLTSNFLFLGYAGLVIVMFFLNRPSPEATSNDLELNQTDKMKLLDPNSLVAEIAQRDNSDD